MQQVNMPNSFLDLTLCAVLPQAGNNIAKAAWSQDKKVRVGGGPRFRRLIPNQESYGCYNRFTSLPSPDLVEEDVALSNHEQVPDRSPKRRKREYTQDQISNVPVKSERGRQQELDYNKIGEVLRKRVKTDSQNELHSEGPYGKAAEELAWGNNKRRRKQLYTIWHHNRGNVQVQPNCIETSQSSIPDSEDQSMDDHVVYANLEQVLPTKKREKDGQRQKYCICNMPWRSIDNIMVECEKCQQWYHCSCLGLPPCPNSKAVAIFTCGQNSCSSTELKLVFSPRSENLSCKNKIRQTLKESETEKELFRDIKFPKVRHSTGQPDSTNANQKQAQLPRVQRRNHKRKSIQAVVTTQPGKTRPETTWPVTTRSGTAQPVITFSETTRTVTTQPLITHSETARPVTTQPVTTLLESTPMETTLLESTPMETTLADLTSPVITPPVTTPAVTTPLHTRTIIKQMQRISSIVDSAADTCRRVKIFNEQHMETFTELMISLDKTVEKLDSVDSFGLDTIQNQKKQNIQMFQKFLGDFEKNKSDTSENCEKCVKEYNSVSTSEDSSDDNLDFPPLDNSVLESILQRKIPKHFFECTLPEKAEFVLDAKDWKNVCDTQEGKGFARGEWQHIMASGIKESNKHCVFMFEGHYVSMAKKRKMKKNAVFFKTSAICKFEDCPVVVNVTVHEKDSFNVLVEYTGHVKHHVTHMHARPVSGKERRDIKKKMEHGLKAWPLYTEKVRDGDKDLIISGNVNGIGKDSRILNQIAYESRQKGKLHPEPIISVRMQMKEQKRNGNFGFIQRSSDHPTYIIYISEAGVRFFHKLASTQPIYWDATGSVVKRSEDGKRFLFYELIVKNPIQGKGGVPVASMITEDQSFPVILGFLECLRHKEKVLFGHNSVCQPRIIKSDESMVLILAAIKGFNWETLNGYLQRCWNIFKGTASVTDATKKTIVHLCASHFMNKVKKFCLLNYKRNIKFGMYMISLLMNARTMSEAEQILHDICVSLKNPTLNAVTKQSVERLMVKINNFDTSVADAETSVQTEGTPGDEKIVKSGSYTEEDYLLLGDKSPFKTWANQIAANTDTDSSDKEANPFFSLKYMEHILKFYLPLFPLWSALLLGDLTTFNPLYKMHKNSLILAKTTALSENRFRIIKNLHLDDRTQSRIDVFSHMLYEATTSAQIIAARDCLKAPSLIGKHQKNTYKKKTQLLQERWAKRKPQPANLKRTKGIFQSPPNDKFSLPATEKKQDSHRGKICTPVGDHSDTNSIQSCGMLNKGNTCWFNATIQALHASNISTRMLESTTKQSPVEVESCGKRRQAIDKEKNSILDILMFLKCERECKDQVPSQLVEQALKCVVDANPDAFTIEQQQDVHEFYTSIVQFMGEKKDREVLIRETRVCKKNGCNLEGLEHDLLLAFPDKSSKVRGRITLFQLMSQSQNFGSGKTVECNQCEEDASQSYKIVQLPNTVIILLKRFRFENGRSSKVMDKIEIDQVLNLSQFCDTNISSNMSYHLKSVVCHHGASLATGHYTTFVLDKTKQHFIEYDDLNVSTRPLNDSRLASGSYVFMYDRVPAKIPAIIRPMLKCLSYTGGLQQASTENFGQARSMSLKKQMLKSIASGHIDNHTLEALESGLGTISCSYRSCIELIEAVDTFLFKQDENSVSVGIECFESVCEKIWKCRNCQRRKHKSSQLLILEVDRLTVSTCVDALQKVGPSDFPQRCNCQSDNFQVFVSALPKTLLVHVKDCTSLMTGDFYVPEISTLNIQSSVICALPLLGGTYTAVSALAFDSGGACSLLKKVGGRLEKQSDSSTGNAVSLQSCSEVLLFYDKQPSTVVYVLPSYCSLDFSQLESLSLGSLDEVTLQRRKFKQTVIQNMVIDQRMINSLTKPQNWLTSKEINAYMHLLCNLSIGKIHSVDSGWFSQKLLSGNFTKIVVYGSESRHLSWARFDFVLIPINEDENRHWTMCVVDMKNKIVYYSNSLTTENRDLVFQLFRYLAYEVLVHEGEIIKFSDWRCCFFSSNKAFQKQNDGSSCGVFVCATAKAIVLRKKLPVHPEFATLYRYKMAVELMKGCIEEE